MLSENTYSQKSEYIIVTRHDNQMTLRPLATPTKLALRRQTVTWRGHRESRAVEPAISPAAGNAAGCSYYWRRVSTFAKSWTAVMTQQLSLLWHASNALFQLGKHCLLELQTLSKPEWRTHQILVFPKKPYLFFYCLRSVVLKLPLKAHTSLYMDRLDHDLGSAKLPSERPEITWLGL